MLLLSKTNIILIVIFNSFEVQNTTSLTSEINFTKNCVRSLYFDLDFKISHRNIDALKASAGSLDGLTKINIIQMYM